ncbi:MAG: serine/threonine-protein kinase [Planctomycetota bacterium]
MSQDSDPTPAGHHAPSRERAGDQIDRYRLLQVVGEGGMGSVWMAEQSEPVRRRVALKIIKLGMDTREVVARFEAERQALALMDHPHIAKVLDGGSTGAGRPYFVMELVKGVPITQYCDEAQLGVAERLQLFMDVCQAIQHAHQKGIIHRDIKPSNVLVTLQDGRPSPKVIDFGIAKATTAELTHRTVFTEVGQLIGTPEYMAPEQAGTDGLDIDTRADVYALGILLYELLTGTKALDVKAALREGYQELIRLIREVDPEKPSTRISGLGDDSELVAKRRRTETTVLGRRLRGDLDVIVMKAIEKERSRRYDTASEFAADIQRFLLGEPVLAVPPSLRYRASKFIARRKKTVITVALFAGLLVAGAAGTGIGWWRTTRANRLLDAAVQEAKETTRQLGEVVDFQAEQLAGIDVASMGMRLKAQLLGAVEAAERDEAAAHLASVNFTDLALDSLDQGLLKESGRAIDQKFEDQPAVRARLLQTLGNTYFTLGLYEDARSTQKEALDTHRAELGPEHADTISSQVDWGISQAEQGQWEEARATLEEAVATSENVLGAEHPQTASAMTAFADLLMDQSLYDEAQARYEACLELLRRVHGPRSREAASVLNSLGGLHVLAGRLDKADPLLVESLEIHREQCSPTDPDLMASLSTFGFLRQSQGRLDEAGDIYREALATASRERGDAHPSTLHSRENLAYLSYERGDVEESEAAFEAVAKGYLQLFGEDHARTLKALGDHAALCQVAGKLEKSAVATRRVLGIARRVLGNENVQTLIQLNNLSHVLKRLGENDEALSLAQEYKAGILSALPDDLKRLGECHYHLGELLFTTGHFDESETEFRALKALRKASGAEPSWRDANLMSCIGEAVSAQGRFEEAEPILIEAAEELVLRKDLPPRESRQGDVGGEAIRRVIESYERWLLESPSDAENAVRETTLAEWRERAAAWRR